MKSILFFCLFFSFFQASFAQKMKDDYLYCDFVKPPKSTKEIAKTYVWEVTETEYNSKMQRLTNRYTSGQQNYGRGQFFAAHHMFGMLGEFEHPLKQIPIIDNRAIASCLIQLEIGAVNLAQITPSSNGKLSEQVDAATALCFEVYVSVPMTFKMWYIPEGTSSAILMSTEKTSSLDTLIFFDETSEPQMHVYKFPKDFEPLKNTRGYSTQAQLDIEFQKNKGAFLQEKKNQIIGQFVKKARLEIASLFTTTKIRLPVVVYYTKDKENTNPELEVIAIRFKEIEKLLNINIELKNNMNWFTPEIQTIVDDVLAKSDSFIAQDKLSHSAKTAARMNRIWLYFMKSRFDEALQEISELEKLRVTLIKELQEAKDNNVKLDKSLKSDLNQTIDYLRYFKLDEIRPMIEDFIPRYENNKDKLGWRMS